jgi:hypothetical protein
MNLQTRTHEPESPPQCDRLGEARPTGGAPAPLQVTTRRRRPWDRLIIGWQALTLDAELAAGRSADDARLRALRGDLLIAPAHRVKLAGQWEALLARASRPRGEAYPRLPLRRAAILAAEADILALVAALRGPLPVRVRGVAIASLLMTDGTGPVYRAPRGTDLATAVQSALRHLDPATELVAAR